MDEKGESNIEERALSSMLYEINIGMSLPFEIVKNDIIKII